MVACEARRGLLGKGHRKVVTPLGKFRLRLSFWLSRLLGFCILLAYCLLLALLLALCLFICPIAYIAFTCFIYALYMLIYLFGAIIHAFWVVNTLFYTVVMPPHVHTPYVPAFWHDKCFLFTTMSTTPTHNMSMPFAVIECCLLAMFWWFSSPFLH